VDRRLRQCVLGIVVLLRALSMVANNRRMQPICISQSSSDHSNSSTSSDHSSHILKSVSSILGVSLRDDNHFEGWASEVFCSLIPILKTQIAVFDIPTILEFLESLAHLGYAPGDFIDYILNSMMVKVSMLKRPEVLRMLAYLHALDVRHEALINAIVHQCLRHAERYQVEDLLLVSSYLRDMDISNRKLLIEIASCLESVPELGKTGTFHSGATSGSLGA